MWTQLVIDTLVRPRRAARQVIDFGVPQGHVLLGAVMVTCLGMVVNFVALRMMPVTVDSITESMLRNPVLGAVQELLFLFLTAFLTVRIGRLFGGRGLFRDGLVLLVWLNVVAVLVEVAQIVLISVLPSIDALIAVVAFGPLLWLAWVYANFVAELHGFRNPFFVLGGMMLTALVLFFAVAIVLSMLGFVPPRVS